MKKVVLLLSAMILCYFTTSLAVDNLYDIKIAKNLTAPLSSYEELTKLPKEYLPDTAVKNGDVVLVQRFQYNVDKLDNFIEAYDKKTLPQSDMVRITRYTVEGAPIIGDLTFANNKLTFKEDKSRDYYLSPDDLIIKEYEIKRIYTKVIKDTIFYMIETTSGERLSIAALSIN